MQNENSKISVLLIDDHPVIRQGIIKLLETENDIFVCGEAENAESALSKMRDLTPDVAIVDIFLNGPVNGIELINKLNKAYPDTSILVLSMVDETIYAERAINGGAKAYIPKNEAPKTIINAIRQVNNNELFINSTIASIINGDGSKEKSFLDVLTNRELEIFRLLGNGLVIKDIAEMLNLSKHTVETHRRNIKQKLKLKNNNILIKSAAQWIIS